MRCTWVVLVLFLVVGCGKKEPWPAAAVSFQGFSTDQQKVVTDALSDMNQRAGRKVVDLSASSTGFPVTLQLGTPNDQSTTIPDERAGVASVSTTGCTIYLSTQLFSSEFESALKPVVWHEMGHCAGLGHVSTSGEVMYPTTNSLDSYQEPAISRFFGSVLKSAGL